MAWLLGVSVAAAVAKLFEGWIPRAADRVLLAAGITLPLVATGYAGWMLSNGSVGWLEIAPDVRRQLRLPQIREAAVRYG